MITIHKVKLHKPDDQDKTRLTVAFTRKNKGTTESGEVTSEEGPRPELLFALNELQQHVVDICELPADYITDLKVIGVTISDTEGVLGAVISAKKKLENSRSPLVIHTPHKLESDAAGRSSNKHLSVECVRSIRKLMNEAEKFVKGGRAQKDLFKENEEGQP